MDQNQENVIACCYVIECKVYHYVEPIIYLNKPSTDVKTQKLHMFYNVFEAKKFIDIANNCAFTIEICKEYQNLEKEKNSRLKIVQS